AKVHRLDLPGHVSEDADGGRRIGLRGPAGAGPRRAWRYPGGRAAGERDERSQPGCDEGTSWHAGHRAVHQTAPEPTEGPTPSGPAVDALADSVEPQRVAQADETVPRQPAPGQRSQVAGQRRV